MTTTTTIHVPDIGDFAEVAIIEVLVHAGDSIAPEDPLITLESDKASMDIPAPQGGIVRAVHLRVGDKVSEGTPILDLEVDAQAVAGSPATTGDDFAEIAQAPAPAAHRPPAATETDQTCQVLVLGSGPGGYTAAFRAADLGLDVLMVERYPELGGVCLNVGCIPSKALLHAAEVIEEAERFADFGVRFGAPEIEVEGLRRYKSTTVNKLTQGLRHLAKQRKVRVVQGVGQFLDAQRLAVTDAAGAVQVIGFEHAIIAAGSQSVRLPGFPWDDPRVMDSTGALELEAIPKRLLVIGGGIIGLEMACVYDALGSEVTVVELSDTLMPGADRDLLRPLEKRIRKRYANIFLQTKVTRAEATEAGIVVHYAGEAKGLPEQDCFDRVLIAVGRQPNGRSIAAEAAGVEVNERGFIPVDSQMRTNIPHIFAIGDVVGQPMLAHKATHEGKVAAEVIAGHKVYFDARAIPSVAYTHPEVAWMGVTETQAKAEGLEYQKGVFPWAASGRALALGAEDGLTKLLFDTEGRVIGAGLVGPMAGDLISEAMLALEMGADMADIGLTIHPHPTLSETVAFAAEVAHGSITDILPPKRRS